MQLILKSLFVVLFISIPVLGRSTMWSIDHQVNKPIPVKCYTVSGQLVANRYGVLYGKSGSTIQQTCIIQD